MPQAGVPTGPFCAADRLLDSRDYRRVMRQGRRLASRDLVLLVATQPEGRHSSKKAIENRDLRLGSGSRLGITVSRKVGNAVCRNRFKRRVRAWFRQRREEFDSDVDLVVIARKSGGQLDWAGLDKRLNQLLGLKTSESRS